MCSADDCLCAVVDVSRNGTRRLLLANVREPHKYAPLPQPDDPGGLSSAYGLAGTLGPGLVAVLASATSPLAALLTLAAATVVAAALTLTLPRTERAASSADTLAVREALRLLVAHGPLRRVGWRPC